MAILLTNQYTKIGETLVWSSGNYKAYIRTYGMYTEQSKENNQTTIMLSQRFYYNQGSKYYYHFSSATARLDGTSKSLEDMYYYGGREYVIQEVTRVINHNEDGSSPIKNISCYWDDSVTSAKTWSIDVEVPKIDRYPIIKSVSTFDDTQNPTISYTTSLGFEGATVDVGIFDSTGTTQYVSYKTINLSNETYTFNLTTSERNALRNATPNSNTLNLQFKLRTTTTSSVEYFSTFNQNMTIVNANPTETHSVEEQDAQVIGLLGGATTNYVINGASDLYFEVTPSAKKGASISSVKINGVALTLSNNKYSITINNISTGTFELEVVDTRGNSVNFTISKTLIAYMDAKINNWSFKRATMTSSNLILDADITCFSGNFNATPNVATLKYSIDDTNWVTIPSSSYTFQDNKITLTNVTLTNVLPYTDNGTLYLEVFDLLTISKENKPIPKGVATFEAGKTEFQVNGDLIVADANRQNEVNILEAIDEAKDYGNVYSSDEIEIGKWVDGSTIYRKVIKSVSTYGTGINIAHNISGLKRVIRCDIVASDDNGTSYPAYNTSFTLQVVQINSTNIKMNIASGFGSGWPVYYIMEYTKTS